jgi:hypothetical protein
MRTFLLIFSLLVWFPVLAQQTESFETELALTLSSSDENFQIELGVEQNGLHLVEPHPSVHLSVRARISRISAIELFIEIDKRVPVRAYEEDGINTYELTDFVIEDEPDKLDQIMELQPGVYASDRNSQVEGAQDFVSTLSQSEGVTEEVLELRAKRLPLRIVEINSLIMNVNAGLVLTQGRTKLGFVSYRAISPLRSLLPGESHKMANYGLHDLGESFPRDSEFIESYLSAIEDLKTRFLQLEARGWSDGLSISALNRRNIENEKPLDHTNVVTPLRARLCKSVF